MRKPAGGKSKKSTDAKTAKAKVDLFSFIPPVGILDVGEQFTRDGWEKVTPNDRGS